MPEPVQVAFRCYGSDWGMRGHGSRQVDWLIDGKLLHKDNVLFVIDQPIDSAYLSALKKKYRVYDCTPRYRWFDKRRWLRFLSRWQPKHWVSYNDYHPRHKIRNQILRAGGVQTWHYSHSINLPTEGYQPWKELDYDHLILWNETDAAQFEGGQKHILGPLFSSQIPRVVIAVFDSTWEHYHSDAKDRFFATLYRLLARYPGMAMLYKPKLKPAPMPDITDFYVLPEWLEPGLVIGCANLTIGLIGSSPVVEAQGAGKPAMWFDPMTQSVEDLDKFLYKVKGINLYRESDPAQRFRELLVK